MKFEEKPIRKIFRTRRLPKKTTTRSVTRAAKEKAAAEAAAQTEAASLTYEIETEVTYEAEITDVSSQMELEQEGEDVDSTNTSTQMEVEEPDNDNNSLQMDLDTSITFEQPPLTTQNISFPTPTNLHLVRKPFKNPHYKTPKKFKTLKQILAAERNLNTPLDVPTYSNIEAPPSIRPQKKYCDITGLEAKYTDPKTRLRYHSAEVYKEIKQLAPGVIQDYLGLRHAAVVLR
ncbi:18057_t:CDS:2 [Rhizophagus irregularis]|nr:18057_t:CDS:2 [Rhizophagus irregularis]